MPLATFSSNRFAASSSKTTSFYMIVGLLRADGGEILLDGHRIESLPIHRRARLGLGYLPQEASIFRKLTVAQNVRAVRPSTSTSHGPSVSTQTVASRSSR